jgi:glutamine synthetase
MEILELSYSRTINIEAHTTLEMARKQIAPAVSLYCKELASCIYYKKELGIDYDAEMRIVKILSSNNATLLVKAEELEKLLEEVKTILDLAENAKFFYNKICKSMNEMRIIADEMENYTARTYWPFPTYGDLMFCI